MLGNCSFETDRLIVDDWQLTFSEHEAGEILLSHISEDARQFLPDSLASIRIVDDATGWLWQQRSEGTAVLYARLTSSQDVVAVLIASKQSGSAAAQVYIGYLVSPEHRGIGFATELVQGFVNWAEVSTSVGSIVAGVDSSNLPSNSVLAKSGFIKSKGSESSDGYLTFERRMNR